jgi:UDP:flavonoid glycosyltransferase YjiC (YdhE family)
MHITILAIGSRGDVQPLLALGLGLKEAGHEVEIMAGINFQDWVKSHGFGFIPTIDMEAVMKSEKGLIWAESSDSPFRQLRMMGEIMREHRDEMINSVRSYHQETDLLVGGFVSEPMVQSFSEKSGVPYMNAMLQPHQPTASGPASLNPVVARGHSILNRWAGHLTDRLLWSFMRETTNYLRESYLGLPPHSARSYLRARRQAQTILGASPHVVPPAQDWPSPTTVTGYWFLGAESGWQPPADLVRFLDGGPPPVYIGFGSMSNRNPQATVDLILAALEGTGQRALLASGWANMHREDLPFHVCSVASVPHQWLFERVAAVVHHGGAGTTAAGLRAGKPTMIVPHLGDQPYWGRRVYELGVGVKPVPRHRLTVDGLAAGIRQLVGDSVLAERAQTLGEQIRAEDGVARAVEVINAF